MTEERKIDRLVLEYELGMARINADFYRSLAVLFGVMAFALACVVAWLL